MNLNYFFNISLTLLSDKSKIFGGGDIFVIRGNVVSCGPSKLLSVVGFEQNPEVENFEKIKSGAKLFSQHPGAVEQFLLTFFKLIFSKVLVFMK